ncbi:hypothetical protein KC361_g9445 [Hortaea werneckii]|nr:hypothetical protein KC361_g9445 [Hortaea werneckii]
MDAALGELSFEDRVCEMFARGECRYGSECSKLHPPELNPNCTRAVNFQFPRAPNHSCVRCVQAGFPCDKPAQPAGEQYPCSECRWFGGQGTCRLSGESVNDAMWKDMMVGHHRNFALLPYRPRNQARLRKSQLVTPSPMPDDKVAHDWRGESKEQLLAKGDPIPAEVRARPRAYLTPPNKSRRVEKYAARVDGQGKKRKAETEAQGTLASQANAPYSMQSYEVPDIPAPPRDSRGADALSVTFNFVGGSVASASVLYPGINGEEGRQLTSYPAQRPQVPSAVFPSFPAFPSLPQAPSTGLLPRPPPKQTARGYNLGQPAPKKPRATTSTAAQSASSSAMDVDTPATAQTGSAPSTAQAVSTTQTGSAPSTTQAALTALTGSASSTTPTSADQVEDAAEDSDACSVGFEEE